MVPLNKLPRIKSWFRLAVFLAILCTSGLACAAQAPAAGPAAPQLPLEPPQVTAALTSCTTQYQQQNIPKSQYHSFMTECVNKIVPPPALAAKAAQ